MHATDNFGAQLWSQLAEQLIPTWKVHVLNQVLENVFTVGL